MNFIKQQVILFNKELYSFTGNHFLLQEIISFYRKSFPYTGNHFLLQEIISFYRKSFSFTGNHFLSQRKQDVQQMFRLSHRILWEPGSQVPRKNPALVYTILSSFVYFLVFNVYCRSHIGIRTAC